LPPVLTGKAAGKDKVLALFVQRPHFVRRPALYAFRVATWNRLLAPLPEWRADRARQFSSSQQHFYSRERRALLLYRGGGMTVTPRYLISDVSRMVGVPAHRIAYVFMAHNLAEPSLRLGNCRVFRRADVRRVAQGLGRPLGEPEDR
jgi:hypothetical protein